MSATALYSAAVCLYTGEVKILLNWLVSALVILAISYILPGVQVTSFIAAAVAALVLGVLNVLIKPVLILLTLPITILTLGLFTLVINALLVMLTSAVVPGFVVDNFLWALLFGLVLSIVNAVLK